MPLMSVSDKLKMFITEHFQRYHPRDDHREFLQLAASMVGLSSSAAVSKPGTTLHRACWMVKAIYSMKIELLCDGNESVVQLTARELQGIQQFNRFVVNIYIQSWFSCGVAAAVHPSMTFN